MLEGEIKHIKQSKKGNKESFGLLYDHYLPKIFRFILFKVTNRAEAEDLVHEVFLSAWQNIHRYRYEGYPFSSWLYQIARNSVIDYYRTSKKNLNIENIDEEIIKINAHYPEKLDAALEIEKLKQVIKLLKPDYQDVIIMRFVEDLSCQEIAITLNKSEGAIRLVQHRALKELKSFYNYGKITNEA